MSDRLAAVDETCLRAVEPADGGLDGAARPQRTHGPIIDRDLGGPGPLPARRQQG